MTNLGRSSPIQACCFGSRLQGSCCTTITSRPKAFCMICAFMMDNPARPVVLITLSTPNANGFHSPIALDMTARHHTALQEEVKCRGIHRSQ